MAERATEDMMDMLHRITTEELINRIRSGEASTADIRAAIDWLGKNDITSVAVVNSPLAALAGLVPEDLTFEDVARHL